MAGAPASVTDDADKPVDGNACTDDVCTGGVPSNPNLSSGTTCGTSLMCNGQGALRRLPHGRRLRRRHRLPDRAPARNGICGVNNAAAGTALPPTGQTAGDCKKVQCDGAGQSQTVNDDTDKPVDSNACTQDLCNAGHPSNPAETAGTACSQNGGIKCNGIGTAPACVQCLAATDCTGSDTECHVRTCSAAGVCGVSNTANGTAVNSQATGDCKKNVCNGSGAQVTINDDTDVPADGNACTMDVCMNGAPSHPSLAANAPCNQDGGTRCNGSRDRSRLRAMHLRRPVRHRHGMPEVHLQRHRSVRHQPLPEREAGPAAQMAGDCKKNVCNGTGGIVPVTDSNDVPVDNNDCTIDICNNDTPSNTPRGAGAPCNGGICTASSACVQCLQASDCGVNTACKTFSCSVAGACSSSNTADGMLVTNTPAGNCHKDVCMSGNITTVVDNSDVLVDGNPCTDDVCTGGVPSNPLFTAGTDCGGNQMCNATGSCVGCLQDSDCGTDTACRTFSCSAAGVCSSSDMPNGTLVTNAPAGNCHADVCMSGIVTTVVDDNDKPSTGGNQCLDSVCTNGAPSTPPTNQFVACSMGTGTECDGAGACVECVNASECGGGPDTVCHTRTCTNGACGISFALEGTPNTTQMSGDCKQSVCDGAGLTHDIADDSDGPANNNECAMSMCMGGASMTTNVSHGTSCTQNSGRTCDGGGTCVLSFDVVRVGDGAAVLTTSRPRPSSKSAW